MLKRVPSKAVREQPITQRRMRLDGAPAPRTLPADATKNAPPPIFTKFLLFMSLLYHIQRRRQRGIWYNLPTRKKAHKWLH